MSDTTDDLECGIDLWYGDEADIEREKEWLKGFHTTKTGDTLKIKEMKTSHIQNTINYFYWLNVTPLKKELTRRKLYTNH